MSEDKKLSEGQFRVGVSFNPSGENAVDVIKVNTADMIDYIAQHGKDPRCTAEAMTCFENAAMWAVKSVTKPQR